MLTSSLNASEHHRAARHIQFIADSRKVNCYRPADLIRNYEDACFFVRNTYTCDENVNLVNYLEFVVCDLKIDKSFLGCVVLLIITALLLSIYLSCLYVNIKFFITPNLIMLIENCKIDEYHFGLIVIALLLFFPDLLKEMFVCGSDESISLLITSLIGKTLHVFIIGIITICIRGSFKLNKTNFTANLFLLIVGNVIVAESVQYKMVYDNLDEKEKGHFSIEIISLLLFVTYFIYISLGIYISFRKKRKARKRLMELGLNISSKRSIEEARTEAIDAGLIVGAESIQDVYDGLIAVQHKFRIFRMIRDIINRYIGYILNLLGRGSRTSQPSSRLSETEDGDSNRNPPDNDSTQQSTNKGSPTNNIKPPKQDTTGKDLSAWELFLHALNPYDNIHNAPSFLLVVVAPIWYLMAITIPVIDKNRPQHGWSQYVVVISLLLSPIFYSLYGFLSRLTFFILEGCALIFILIILFFTKAKQKPRCLTPFAIMGVLIGFSIFSLFDNEIDTISNQLLIYLWDWERDTVEILLCPLNFSLAECIICWNLIKANHSQAAYGFIIGVTMIGTFMVLPTITFKLCYSSGTQMGLTAFTTTAYIYLILVLTFIWFGVAMTNFVLRWAHAIFLTGILCVFFVFLMFAEANSLHPYGSKHSLGQLLDQAHANWA